MGAEPMGPGPGQGGLRPLAGAHRTAAPRTNAARTCHQEYHHQSREQRSRCSHSKILGPLAGPGLEGKGGAAPAALAGGPGSPSVL